MEKAANSPLYLHPEILDEVLKYVLLPRELISAIRSQRIRSGSEFSLASAGTKKPRSGQPLGKQPRHRTLGRDAHSVTQLVVAPSNFPRSWDNYARCGAPARIGTHRFDRAVVIEAKKQCHFGWGRCFGTKRSTDLTSSRKFGV